MTRFLLLLPALLLVAVSAAAQPALTLTDDRARRELVLELGPVDLPAGSHDDIDQPPPLEVELPADLWLQGVAVELVDGRGAAVPRQVIHHVNVMQPGRRELFSPVMLRLVAVGQETGDVRLPWFLGIPVGRGSTLLVTAMFHNPTAAAYHDVRLRLRVPYRPRDAWPAATAVMPFYLDVMPHGGFHSWDLPPGRSERSWEGSPAVAGRIVGLSGHLHRYGTLLRLEDVTEGQVIWEARPRVDAGGEVVGMPVTRYLLRRPRLEPSRVYRLTAVYENPTGRTIPDGAMGALGGALVPGIGRPWPLADPLDPEYVQDREFTWVGSREHPRGHGGHDAHDGHHGHGAGHEQ